MSAPKLLRLAENEIRRTLHKLPPDIRAAAEECQVIFDDGEDDDGLLGVFEGNSRLDPPPADPVDMPCITLFLQNLWEFAGKQDRPYRREVRKTFLHELGHYLGWDEEEIEALGLG